MHGTMNMKFTPMLSVDTSQKTNYILITKTRVIKCSESSGGYCKKNHVNNVNTLCGKSWHFLMLEDKWWV
jgi:hypothetical protein